MQMVDNIRVLKKWRFCLAYRPLMVGLGKAPSVWVDMTGWANQHQIRLIFFIFFFMNLGLICCSLCWNQNLIPLCFKIHSSILKHSSIAWRNRRTVKLPYFWHCFLSSICFFENSLLHLFCFQYFIVKASFQIFYSTTSTSDRLDLQLVTRRLYRRGLLGREWQHALVFCILLNFAMCRLCGKYSGRKKMHILFHDQIRTRMTLMISTRR